MEKNKVKDVFYNTTVELTQGFENPKILDLDAVWYFNRIIT